jgi:hypothetical protein
MRVLERRLRRLEVGLLPPAETAESRRLHEIVLDIRRRRAERLGLPVPEDVPEPIYRPGMSLANGILDDRSLNTNTFRADYVLMGYALPEEARCPAVH